TGGQVSWTAPATATHQSVWALVRNPYAAGQTSFCDAAYRVELAAPGGNLDNPDTYKTAVTGPNRTITYTIVLSNSGQPHNAITVTDRLPAGVSLLSAAVSPAGAAAGLISSTTAITWVGQVGQAQQVEITLAAVAGPDAGSLENTARIDAGQPFLRTSEAVTFAPEPQSFFIYLPTVAKGF
ncbi:MAG: hypothetical protein ACE5G8_18455, partial [Anaerolineae bacterium]